MEHKPFFWIIDNEWPDYSVETALLRKAFPDCRIECSGIPFEDDLERFGAQADVVLAQISADMSAGVIARLDRCRGIAVFGSGYNNVDVAAARARGIPVTNVNGYCSEDIADYVLAVIFHYYKKISHFSAHIGDGCWGAEAVDAPIPRLNRQPLLMMGFGYIGSVTARRAAALGMKVLVYDPYQPEEKIRACGAEPVTLDEGLRCADYVSVHVRLTELTQGLINKDLLRKMKKTAILINVARGALVKEDDLIAAVREGMIGGAVLDVVTEEPIRPDSPLLQTENILVTPHISYASEESLLDLRERAVNNALAMYRGETPQDLIKC